MFPEGVELFKIHSVTGNWSPKTSSFFDGILSEWWVSVVLSDQCISNSVKIHDGSCNARFLTLKRYFCTDALLSHLMCVISTVLRDTSDSSLFSGTPQILLSSSQGFSARYWIDKPPCTYRVFVYLGCERDPAPQMGYKTNTAEGDYTYLIFGGDVTMKLERNGKHYNVITLGASVFCQPDAHIQKLE